MPAPLIRCDALWLSMEMGEPSDKDSPLSTAFPGYLITMTRLASHAADKAASAEKTSAQSMVSFTLPETGSPPPRPPRPWDTSLGTSPRSVACSAVHAWVTFMVV